MNYGVNEQPTQPRPEFQPPPISAPQYTQPVTNQPVMQPTGMASFNLDTKTREILSTIHPELLNAVVNIAIKKFSTTEDFLDYYVQDQFKAVVEAHQEAVQSSSPKEPEPTQAPAASGMDFSTW